MSTFFEEMAENSERIVLGPYTSFALKDDPKHLLFSMARYKFCAKMLARCKKILEVGCGEGVFTSLFVQNKCALHCIDTNEKIIKYNIENNMYPDSVSYDTHDIIRNSYENTFDAVLSLDVIEHIPSELEDDFLGNIALSCADHATCIIGTPNIAAAPYASQGSKDEHINLHSHTTLVEALEKHFHTVFLFSMNDEVVHTGFYPMAHYLMALAVGPKHL